MQVTSDDCGYGAKLRYQRDLKSGHSGQWPYPVFQTSSLMSLILNHNHVHLLSDNLDPLLSVPQALYTACKNSLPKAWKYQLPAIKACPAKDKGLIRPYQRAMAVNTILVHNHPYLQFCLGIALLWVASITMKKLQTHSQKIGFNSLQPKKEIHKITSI